jgi:hypothetical protein
MLSPVFENVIRPIDVCTTGSNEKHPSGFDLTPDPFRINIFRIRTSGGNESQNTKRFKFEDSKSGGKERNKKAPS